MKLNTILISLALLWIHFATFSQTTNTSKDSLFIEQIENIKEPVKVLHAEPLYIDLIRDLGARKGEKEFNLGVGLTDNLDFDSYEALVEYEWAPIDRLGFEIELPFTFYSPNIRTPSSENLPSNRLNSLKLATQWSFFVNEKISTSMALGYIHEFELSDFQNFGNPFIKGNVYNPFFIVAKRWGRNFHSLIYTGPVIERDFISQITKTSYEAHTSFHYMISGTRNFIGVEVNKSIHEGRLLTILRPQMRVGIADNLIIGIVTGIPLSKNNERLSSFLRLIWEPKH